LRRLSAGGGGAGEGEERRALGGGGANPHVETVWEREGRQRENGPKR
jgi:hypothetical protein